MATPDDQGGAVEHLTVQVDLAGEPTEAVPVGLDLVSVERPVHHRDVDPHAPTAEPKLFDEGGVRLPFVSGHEPPQKRSPDLAVTGRDGRRRSWRG